MTLREQTDAILEASAELHDKIQQQPLSQESESLLALSNQVMLLAKIASDLDENVKRLSLHSAPGLKLPNW